MKIKINPTDLGENPVLTLLGGIPFVLALMAICFIVLVIQEKYEEKLGWFGNIVGAIAEIGLKILGIALGSIIISAIFNLIFF